MSLSSVRESPSARRRPCRPPPRLLLPPPHRVQPSTSPSASWRSKQRSGEGSVRGEAPVIRPAVACCLRRRYRVGRRRCRLIAVCMTGRLLILMGPRMPRWLVVISCDRDTAQMESHPKRKLWLTVDKGKGEIGLYSKVNSELTFDLCARFYVEPCLVIS